MNHRHLNTDSDELAKFESADLDWWNPKGPLKGLHDINPLRVQYIKERVDLVGKRVVDIGCGGGILAEALAGAGAQVTGIDANGMPLSAARNHLCGSGLRIDYRQTTAERLAAEAKGRFDVVTCMELLEHVPDPASVANACAKLSRPGGDVFFATLNRTVSTLVLAIFMAEYILGILPKKTHLFSKMIKPKELESWGKKAGLLAKDATGLKYNPLLKTKRLGGSLKINYLMHFKRCRLP